MVDTYDKITELLPNYDEIGRGYIHTFCVFHDDSKKSLLVFPNGRGYRPGFYCLSGECGRKGSLEELLRVLTNAPPRPRDDSEKEKPPSLPTNLSDLATLASDAHFAILDEFAPERRYYLEQRGLADTIVPARLGWYHGWITTPIMSLNGKLMGLYCRSTPIEHEKTGQRFHQPLGQHPMLYAPKIDWYHSSSLFIVFGMMDALTLGLLDLPVVTTTGGSNSFDPSWLDQFRKPITIVPDASGDDKAAIDLAARLGWRARILRLPYDDQVQDPADYAEYGRLEELKGALDAKM